MPVSTRRSSALRSLNTGRKARSMTTGGEVDPGNLQSRWAPCEKTHGSSQGQLPSRSIRPRGMSLLPRSTDRLRNIERAAPARQRYPEEGRIIAYAPLTGSLRSPPLPRKSGERKRRPWPRALPRPHEMGERWRAQRAGEGDTDPAKDPNAIALPLSGRG